MIYFCKYKDIKRDKKFNEHADNENEDKEDKEDEDDDDDDGYFFCKIIKIRFWVYCELTLNVY